MIISQDIYFFNLRTQEEFPDEDDEDEWDPKSVAAAVAKTSDDEDSLATASDAGGGTTPKGTPNSSIVNHSQSTTPVTSLNKVLAYYCTSMC